MWSVVVYYSEYRYNVLKQKVLDAYDKLPYEDRKKTLPQIYEAQFVTDDFDLRRTYYGFLQPIHVLVDTGNLDFAADLKLEDVVKLLERKGPNSN